MLADIVSPPKPWNGEFVDIGPECFAGIHADGTVYLSWRGENYTRQKVTWRVRLHNWLNGIGNRKPMDLVA